MRRNFCCVRADPAEYGTDTDRDHEPCDLLCPDAEVRAPGTALPGQCHAEDDDVHERRGLYAPHPG